MHECDKKREYAESVPNVGRERERERKRADQRGRLYSRVQIAAAGGAR
jgi:hypothetical protein